MLIKVPGVKWTLQRAFRLQRGVTLGVRVVIVDADRRVLLVRHGYTEGWHLPGGGVDRGESLAEAAVREAYEETGARLVDPPRLFGVYTNFAAFPGDHVAVFVANGVVQGATPKPSYEIRQYGYHPVSALPEGTTEGTRRRLAEILDGVPPGEAW